MLSIEPTNTNFKIFGLTRLGLEPTIYRTRGEHVNHYNTDAVSSQWASTIHEKNYNNYPQLYFIYWIGPIVGELLDDIIAILVPCLNPKKDAEMRIKFFSLLSHLVMNAKETLDSRGKFSDVSVIIVKDIIIPNMVWQAGRVASAIRTSAVSCMWALLQSGVLDKEKV